MNNFLNEYFWFNFELNIELNQFLARFNVKMNNQNVSATPTRNPTWFKANWAPDPIIVIVIDIDHVVVEEQDEKQK